MQEKLKNMVKKVKGFFTNMNKKTRTIAGAVLGGVVVAVVVIALVIGNRPYNVLFTGLSADELSSIVTYLNDKGVTDYKVQGTDTVLVAKNQEAQLKANLLMEGYPKSGFAYATYKAGVGSMSTETDRQIAYLQDLQDRMAGVIRCMDGVKSAVVTIAQGDDQRYVLDSSNTVAASASVMVTMNNGAMLTSQQAAAVRNLISHAVKGLDVSNVSISDSQGNTYSAGSTGSTDASQLKLTLEEQVNNKVRAEILAVLTPLYGEDNVRVAVNSTVNIDHTVGETTTYTEPAWAKDGSTGGEGIIGSKVYDKEVVRGKDATVGGTVGNQSNSDIDTYVDNNTTATVTDDQTYIRNQGTNTYNVNTDKEQVERIAGRVSDVMVSVTINRSGTSQTTAGSAELLSHIARAAGIGADVQASKISILMEPFYSKTADSPTLSLLETLGLPSWTLYAAGGALLVLLLLIIFIASGKKNKKRRQRAEVEDLIGSMPKQRQVVIPEDGADIMNIRTEKSILLRQQIRKIAEENPEMAAQMLKSWMRGQENG